MKPKCGEIYLVNLDPVLGSEMAKTRPAVIVSPAVMNEVLATVVVCPMTSKLHPTWATRVRTLANNQPGEVAVDQIRTISKQRLIRKLGTVSDSEQLEIKRIISEVFGNG